VSDWLTKQITFGDIPIEHWMALAVVVVLIGIVVAWVTS